MPTFLTPVSISVTSDATWNDVDLSANVPASQTAFFYFQQNGFLEFDYRTKGSTNDNYRRVNRYHRFFFCGVDADSKIQLKSSAAATVTLYLYGYLDGTEAIWNADAVELPAPPFNSTTNIDVSALVSPDAEAAIIELSDPDDGASSDTTAVYCGPTGAGMPSFPTNGAVLTTTHRNQTVVALDANKTFDAHTGASSTKHVLHIVGQLLRGFVALTDVPRIDSDSGNSPAWTVIDANAELQVEHADYTHCRMMLIMTAVSASNKLAARELSDTTVGDTFGPPGYNMQFVECDGSGDIEISNDNYTVGAMLLPVAISAPWITQVTVSVGFGFGVSGSGNGNYPITAHVGFGSAMSASIVPRLQEEVSNTVGAQEIIVPVDSMAVVDRTGILGAVTDTGKMTELYDDVLGVIDWVQHGYVELVLDIPAIAEAVNDNRRVAESIVAILLASDVSHGRSTLQEFVADIFAVMEFVQGGEREAIDDTLSVVDIGTDTRTGTELISDAMSAVEFMDGNMHASLEVFERIAEITEILGTDSESVADAQATTLVVDDALRATATIQDFLKVADTVTPSAVFTLLVVDTVRQEDVVAESATLSETIADAVSMTVRIYESTNNDVFETYVLNAENAAVSEYQNYGFTSLREYRGERYGTRKEGLFKLSGDTDAGAAIQTRLTTGDFEPNDGRKATPVDAWIGVSNDGDLYLKTLTDDGIARSYKVKPRPKSVTSMSSYSVERRVQLAQGVQSVYLRFDLETLDGADVAIDKIRWDIAPLSRRTN